MQSIGEIEYEKIPPFFHDGGFSTLTKYRRSCRLYFFPGIDESVELLFCRCLFEVHWLKIARYQRSGILDLDLEYVREGSLDAIQGNRCYRIMPGELFLMHPGIDAEIRTGPEGFCVKTSLSIHGPLLAEFLHRSGLEQVDRITSIDRPRFELLLEQFKAMSEEPPPAIRQRNGGLSFELLRFLQFPEPEERLPDSISRMDHYIRNHLDASLSCARLAKQAGCSPAHLNGLFRKYYGTSPYRHIELLRMRRAARFLLEFPDLSIKEIAGQVGYSDALNFSTGFKKIFGISPRRYRQEHFR